MVFLQKKIKYYTNLVIFYIKNGKYYIVNFKELFALDGRPTNLEENDIARRNRVVILLEEWNLLEVFSKDKIKEPVAPLNQIKIIPFKDKGEWKLESKYAVGKKKQNEVEGNK